MPKYKVCFSGFAYVEADNEEDAADGYDFGSVYEETEVTSVEEVDEFVITL